MTNRFAHFVKVSDFISNKKQKKKKNDLACFEAQIFFKNIENTQKSKKLQQISIC